MFFSVNAPTQRTAQQSVFASCEFVRVNVAFWMGTDALQSENMRVRPGQKFFVLLLIVWVLTVQSFCYIFNVWARNVYIVHVRASAEAFGEGLGARSRDLS